ncbi:MAG TPA: ATP phosphoribosyltransferase regulatory subunit, partial [Kofleriaceae bacterium]
MQPSPIRLPSGVRDFLPRAAARRRALAARVMDVLEGWTYARVITPMFECADVLERGLGEGARAAAIRFVEPGTGEIVALRPDITPQIARLVATRFVDVPGPIRLCYEGTVTRLAGERGQREIVQAGIEHVAPYGQTDELARAGDAEVLAIACDVLARLSLAEVSIDIGHVAPARYVLDAAPDAESRRAIGAAIARKDRAGVRAAARELRGDAVANALALVDLWGPADEVLARARALAWPHHVLAAFDEVAALLGELASNAPAITLDFSDLRGEAYYTGIRFAAYAGGAHDAILRGGRYDDLIARYGRPLRATGFAIDLEMVAEASRADDVHEPAGVAIASSIADAPA